MTAEEYFGDWIKVIDKTELIRIMKWLSTLDPNSICPSKKNIFKAFKLCPYKELRVVCLGLDPYPQPGIAQGILFGNSKETPENLLSPSLKVVKAALPSPKEGELFDNTMEHWAKQGILMINSALTCQTNIVGPHVAIWRPFISSLLKNISYSKDVCFILFGKQVPSFKPFLNTAYTWVGEVEHPAYFARKGKKMPGDIFLDINRIIKQPIKFYKLCTIEDGTDTLI